MDENRELRAMLLSLLHLPPLPVTVNLVERGDHTIINDQHTESSHAIICNLIEWVAMMNVGTLNNKRMREQMSLQAQFHDELRNMDLSLSDEALYNFFCHHTRLWLNSYTSQGDSIRFKPLDCVSPGDRVHAALLDYAKAQYHHFKEGNETLDIESSLSFAQILRKCAEWSKEWNKDNTQMQPQCLFEKGEAAGAEAPGPDSEQPQEDDEVEDVD
jgi:hypothetical protein